MWNKSGVRPEASPCIQMSPSRLRQRHRSCIPPWIYHHSTNISAEQMLISDEDSKNLESEARVHLKEQPFKPLLPSIFLSGARSITKKTERNGDSGKSRGGGLCVYINDSWWKNAKTLDSYCSPNLEYLTVKWRPVHIPREFTIVMVAAVYVPPDANANMDQLYKAVSSQQKRKPSTTSGSFRSHVHAAQQSLHFLRILRRTNQKRKLLPVFYNRTTALINAQPDLI